MAFKRMFSYAKVDVPNRSGHNVDHRHAFSAKCGTLVPSFSDFLIPGDTVDLSPKFSVQMAPQATDFIGRISLRTELFYVPMRAIWGGWKDFITYASESIGGPAPEDPNYHAKYLPGAILSTQGDAVSVNRYESQINNSEDIGAYWAVTESQLDKIISDYRAKLELAIESGDTSFWVNSGSSGSGSILGAGSLLDYLGFKVNTEGSSIDVLPYMQRMAVVLANPDLPSLIRTNYLTVAAEYRSDGFSQYVTSNGTVGVYKVNASSSVLPTTPDSSEFLVFEWTRFRDEESLDPSNPNKASYIQRATIYPFISLINSGELVINNILKAVAYHKIYDDWYRDARLMKKLFPNALGDNPQNLLGNIAYITKYGGGFTKKYYQGDQLKFYDGKSLFDLRQRLWQKDFFTTMTQAPQSGDAMKVQVTPDADNPSISGEFTIASLRLANAMQLWRERNNLVDSRYGDVQYAQYGVYPSDAVTDRAIYLGSNTVEIYNKSVYQQGEYVGPSNNPIKGIGTKYATPIGVGQGNLCNNYSVTEHGILMALTSIVPEPSYSSGTRRDFHYSTIDDIAFPLLQGVGDQPVYAREIIDTYSGEGDKTVIGYTGRYSEYKFINDHISGLLRDGQSLSAFALQRSFSQPPVLGAEFLEIPENYLDQVSAVGVENSKYGAWIESYWRYSKVSCLSEYNAVPTLGRMPDVHQITVTKAGSRL